MSRRKKSTKRKTRKKKGVLTKVVSFFQIHVGNIARFFTKTKFFSSINVLNFIFICIACLFIYRLYDLQVVRGIEYREQVESQFTKEERGKSISRGDIFFTTKEGNQILAATLRPLYTVAIEPRKIQNKEKLYELVSAILSINKNSFIQKASKANDPYEEIAVKVEKDVVEKLKEIEEPGLVFVLQKERYYPGGDLASSVLGFMSFSGDVFSGSYGLEKYYDEILRRDKSIKTTSIFAALFSDTKEDEANKTDIRKNIAKEGSLNLTIEPTAQALLEEKLDDIVNRWSSEYSAGVIMNARTGEVVAMGTSDNFDLNKDTQHYRNYLIEDRLELGSIIKPLTVAVGLETETITSDFSYDDTGKITLNRFPITNYDNKGRGPLTNLQDILTQSLNTGVATIALQIGHERFSDYFLRLGFAEETGIDLPGEVYGLTSNLDSKKDVEIATASFGQGIAVTPMEAVRAIASIANGGELITPYIVDSIEYGDLIPSKNIQNTFTERIFSEDVTKLVRSYMVNTVDNSETFKQFSNPNYSVGVKTGTAQIAKPTGGYYDDKFLHSMVSFFPAQAAPDEDQYVILLYTIDPKNVRFSSTTLKFPMFELTEFLINFYELPPDRLRNIIPRTVE